MGRDIAASHKTTHNYTTHSSITDMSVRNMTVLICSHEQKKDGRGEVYYTVWIRYTRTGHNIHLAPGIHFQIHTGCSKSSNAIFSVAQFCLCLLPIFILFLFKIISTYLSVPFVSLIVPKKNHRK